jgi:AcrR family transcriptional regulator
VDTLTSARSTRARPSDDDLLDAALGVFADSGYRATTMAAVAVAADSTKPTLYAHFGDKDTLYQRLIEREADACRTWLFAAYERNATLPLNDQVGGDITTFFDYAEAHPHGFALLFGSDIAAQAAAVREALRVDVNNQVATRVGNYLALHSEVRTHPEDVTQLAAMLVGVAVSAAQHAIATGGNLTRAGRLAAKFCTAALLNLPTT